MITIMEKISSNIFNPAADHLLHFHPLPSFPVDSTDLLTQPSSLTPPPFLCISHQNLEALPGY